MPNVFFTWLGPPQARNKNVNGIGSVRPDLFGLLRTAAAQFPGMGPPPNFTLCCLKNYAQRFRADLPDYVDILVVDDAFSTSRFKSIMMSTPVLSDLDQCVDFIIRETLKTSGRCYPGTGYPDNVLPYKKLAFVKDLFSLWVVWKHGGYHLDCGCFPDPKYGGTVTLPEPSAFGVPVVSPQGKVPFNCSLGYAGPLGGPTQATLCGGWASMSGAIAAQTLGVKVTARGASPMNRQVDVWMLRSPAGDPVAEAALRFYIQGWFAMAETGLGVGQNFRELAVASVATAITHGPASPSQWTNHLIEATGGDVPSIGLRKVGFQSHT